MAAQCGLPVAVEDIPISEFFIGLGDSPSDATVDAAKLLLEEALRPYPFWTLSDVRDSLEDLDSTLAVVNAVFAVLTFVVRELCRTLAAERSMS